MESTALTKQRIVAELSRSPHGQLKEYLDIGLVASRQDPDFFAHLIAWDAINGQVRDAKVALPVISLTTLPNDLVENSFAHLAKLNPREFLKAYRFGLEIRVPTRMRKLRALASLYLRSLESLGYWESIAIQHRAVLKELYALTHTKPAVFVNEILFKSNYPPQSVFAVVRQLKDMSPQEAAGTILTRKIPFLIAQGALGAKAKEPDLVLALIKRMSATELITNSKMLEKLGVRTNPSLRGAFESALGEASKSKSNTLKTSRAASAVSDSGLKAKLEAVQEKQIDSIAIEGNWLVLADKSGSMQSSIEAAKLVAAALTKLVKGNVWLTFFDTMPLSVEVTGCSLDIIRKATQHITAAGGTSIGCGLLQALEARLEIDGIAIVSDGCENTAPEFWRVYEKYSAFAGKDVPVHLYRVHDQDHEMYYRQFVDRHDVQVFDLGYTPDYYSLPNLVKTMRSNRYSLVDEIMGAKLLSLKDVLKGTLQEKEVKYVTA